MLLRLELVENDLGPFALFRLKLNALSNGLVFSGSLLSFKRLLILLLLLLTLLDVLPIGNGFIQGFIEKAALVDKWHGHVGAKFGDALIVHSWLTHDLLDVEMLEPLEDVALGSLFCAIFVLCRCRFLKSGVVITKDVVSDTHVGGKDGTLHKLVVAACMDKLDNLRCIVVQMSLVVSIDGNLELWVLQASDVDSCGFRVFLDEVDEARQVVSQVLRLLQSLEEVSLALFLCLSDLFLFVGGALLALAPLAILRLLDGDLLQLQFPLRTRQDIELDNVWSKM